MTIYTAAAPASGAGISRARFLFGSAAAALTLGLLAPSAASAQEACVLIPGSVTCLPTAAAPLFSTGTVITLDESGTPVSLPADAVNAGFVRYDVVAAAPAGTLALIATPSDAALHTARYGTALRNVWTKSADIVSTHMQSRRDALWSMGGTPIAGKFWVAMSGSQDTIRAGRRYGTLGQTNVIDMGVRQDIFGGQIGLDLGGGVGTRGGFAVGLTGGYSNSRARFGNVPDELSVNAINGGAYFSFTQGNIFANGLGKYDYYWADAKSQTGNFAQSLHGHAYGARGEIGLRGGNDSLFIEPLAQFTWVKTSLDGFGVRGTSVSFDDRDGMRGKAGVRIGGAAALGPDNRLSFYVGGNYVHNFKNEGGITLTNAGGTYSYTGIRTPDYGEAVGGISIATNRSVSGFIEGAYSRGFKDGTDATERRSGVAGRAGVTVKF